MSKVIEPIIFYFVALLLPQIIAFLGCRRLKWGCLGVCTAASLAFFCLSVALFFYLLATSPSTGDEPHCGQWIAGVPALVVIGCVFHSLFAAGVYGSIRLFRRLRTGRVLDAPDDDASSVQSPREDVE